MASSKSTARKSGTASKTRAATTGTRSRSGGTKTAQARQRREEKVEAQAAAKAQAETAADGKPDAQALNRDLIAQIKKAVRGVTVKPSPKGAYSTVKVGAKAISYIDIRKSGLLVRFGLETAPADVNLKFEPCPVAGPRFGVQAKVSDSGQIEEALKAVEAAAVVIAK